MSRNKDIKYMHEVTGQPYSVCRKKLKESHWDLWEAMGYGEALALINTFAGNFSSVMRDALDALYDAVQDIAKSATLAVEQIGKMDKQELYDAIMKEVENNEV